MKKVVGKVTDEEKSAIMRLHNHCCSLEELLMILPENEELYKIALQSLCLTRVCSNKCLLLQSSI